MVSVDKSSGYHNQLEFNLDITGPSNLSRTGSVSSSQLIVIEKIPSASAPCIARKLNENHVIPSHKLSFALQLAKLDVSNSNNLFCEHSKLKKCKKILNYEPKEKIKSRKCEKLKATRQVAAKTTQHNDFVPTLKEKTKLVSGEKAIKYLNRPSLHQRAQSNYSNELGYLLQRAIPAFPALQRHQTQHVAFSKDACTSIADVPDKLNNYVETGQFKQFTSTLKGIVKKEKLRNNGSNISKIGYLSNYRTPRGKKKHAVLASQLASKQAQCHGSKLLTKDNFSNSFGHSKVEERVSPIESTNVLHTYDGVNQKRLPKKKSSFDVIRPEEKLTISESKFVCSNKSNLTSNNPTANAEIPIKIFNDKQFVRNATFNPIPVQDDGKAEEESVSTYKAASFAELHRKQLVDDIQNSSDLKSLYQQLLVMENEEKTIRTRWHEIKYDDITYSPSKTPQKIVEYSERCDGNLTAIPHEKTGKNQCYAHEDHKQSLSIEHFSSLMNENQVYCTKNREKLGLPKNIRESILSYRSRYHSYLQTCFYVPKGNFNPWKAISNLSDELIDKGINDVCEELISNCDMFVDQLFENEFAEPNHS